MIHSVSAYQPVNKPKLGYVDGEHPNSLLASVEVSDVDAVKVPALLLATARVVVPDTQVS